MHSSVKFFSAFQGLVGLHSTAVYDIQDLLGKPNFNTKSNSFCNPMSIWCTLKCIGIWYSQSGSLFGNMPVNTY